MRFYRNARCKIWSRACRIDSLQNQLCIFITGMPILIFVRVLDNSSQRAYFRSCDGNTATPLADKRGIRRFMGFPVPYNIERVDVYSCHGWSYDTVVRFLFRQSCLFVSIVTSYLIPFKVYDGRCQSSGKSFFMKSRFFSPLNIIDSDSQQR